MLAENGFNLEEERAACLILEAEAMTCQRESLAGETATKDIEVLGNIPLRGFLGDVTEGHFAIVGEIGLLGLCVVLRGIDTLTT